MGGAREGGLGRRRIADFGVDQTLEADSSHKRGASGSAAATAKVTAGSGS